MLDIGLTVIRQERVQSGGKERSGSYHCTKSVNGMGFVETVLGLEERNQIFLIWDIYRLLSGAGERE